MQAMKFNGSGFEYFKIWIVNILLTIVTLSLYYPWAKVRNRRYFYGNTSLNEQNFEYHATGKQLFVGYLIALVALIVYVIIQQISPAGGGLVFLLLILGLPWIIWRSLIFNMRVSSYSNVRFNFDGRLGGAYFSFLLLPILLLIGFYGFILLGVMLGAMLDSPILGGIGGLIGFVAGIYLYGILKKINNAYVINGSLYGQGHFETKLEAKPFAIILLKTIGLSFLALFLLILVTSLLAMLAGVGSGLMEMGAAMQDPEALEGMFANAAVISVIAALYLGFIFISVALFAYMQARQREYIMQNTTLDGEIKMASTMSARRFAWISFSNLLVIIVTLGLAIPWANVRMARYIAEHTEVDTSAGFSKYVSQQLDAQTTLGDQLGDAFDVDVGIGI